MSDVQTDFKPKSLDEVLGAPEPEVEESKAEELEGKPESEQPEVEEDKGEKVEEKPAEPDKGAPPAPEMVPMAVVLSERRKRQELANTVSELQQQINKQERPDPLEDPDGAAAFDSQVASQRDLNTRVVMSQEMMRTLNADYDEMEAVFGEAAASNPALAAQMVQHPLPAKFAYEEGKRLSQLNEMGADPTKYIEKRVSEAVAAAVAAIAQETKTEQAASVNIPESLAETPSASPKTAVAYQGPKPIADILAAKKR